MEKLIAEALIFLIIGFRIYILNQFNIKSAADKIFSLYYLKNHYPLLGYMIIFYILEVVAIEYILLNKIDGALVILAAIEIFLTSKYIFIPLKTDNKEDYIDTIIKKMFTTLTFSEYQEIKNELLKPQPFWKLYMTEFMVFFFSIWSIEIG